MVLTDGGKLICIFAECAHHLDRTDARIMICESTDRGRTWSAKKPLTEKGTKTEFFNCARISKLRDGRVMVTYRYIPSATQNLFAAFFEPEALTEPDRRAQRGRIMPLDYDRNPSPDLGYTGWAQFEDGEIYVVNYIKDDADKAQIRGYSFFPEDVMFPETENTVKNVF